MIAGFVNKKLIAQQPIADLMKISSGSKSREQQDPTALVKVKLDTPNFAQLSFDRTIFATSYLQHVKDISLVVFINQIEGEAINARENLKNNYKGLVEVNLALKRNISSRADEDSIPVEREKRGPYDNVDINKKNLESATKTFYGYFSTSNKFDEDVKEFMHATGRGEKEAKHYLEAAGKDLGKAISLFNNQN